MRGRVCWRRPAFQSSKAIEQLEKIKAANEECSERLLTFVSSQEDLTSRMLDAILKLMITMGKMKDERSSSRVPLWPPYILA